VEPQESADIGGRHRLLARCEGGRGITRDGRAGASPRTGGVRSHRRDGHREHQAARAAAGAGGLARQCERAGRPQLGRSFRPVGRRSRACRERRRSRHRLFAPPGSVVFGPAARGAHHRGDDRAPLSQGQSPRGSIEDSRRISSAFTPPRACSRSATSFRARFTITPICSPCSRGRAPTCSRPRHRTSHQFGPGRAGARQHLAADRVVGHVFSFSHPA